ncbi:MAG: hypothetical protein PHE56_04620 [Bacteroidales bacterium]|jgi:hypothetical protein|nr:hypothetical protein [Bacteroidales bacterium]
MGDLFKTTIAFIKDNFNLKLYISVVAVTALIIIFEYSTYYIDLTSDRLSLDLLIYPFNFIVFAISYYAVVVMLKVFDPDKTNLSLEFWLKSFAGLMILSLYISFFGHYGLNFGLSYPEIYYYYHTSENLTGIVTLLFPLFLIYLIFDRKSEAGFYGLNLKTFNFKIALILTVVAVLISFVGSKFESVGQYYPILNRTAYQIFAHKSGLNKILVATGFEAAYMFDFIMIELFFRGFMIFGFIKLLGKNAILPVATLYAVIHFGKPLPETISSFFGAYFLGIVAYNQKNIGIGVVLHCALALSMELFTLRW